MLPLKPVWKHLTQDRKAPRHLLFVFYDSHNFCVYEDTKAIYLVTFCFLTQSQKGKANLIGEGTNKALQEKEKHHRVTVHITGIKLF
jgi:hypothetical protein